MNLFIESLFRCLNEAGIFTLLVKGQGIAQCYERPLWRSSGDIDLLLDSKNYEKAKTYMLSHSTGHKDEIIEDKHFEFFVNQWSVELHGDLPSLISEKIDNSLRCIQDETFRKGLTRVWKNGEVDILIPSPNNDVIFVFTHILKHFFRGGIGLRQICDWCRLLWTYKDSYDTRLLEERVSSMGIVSEWKAFASLAINYLGMPVEAMPLFTPATKWERKARRIMSFIIKTGNFGHNRDSSFYSRHSLLVQKIISLWRHNSDIVRYFFIFPIDSMRVWWLMLSEGIVDFIKKLFI